MFALAIQVAPVLRRLSKTPVIVMPKGKKLNSFLVITKKVVKRLELLDDTGTITKKSALPITAFRYGPIEFEETQALIQIKRLKCSGGSL